MTQFSIHPDTQIGLVSLIISDLKNSEIFYRDVIGFKILNRDGNSLTLSADGETPLLILRHAADAVAKPPRTTGLYHFAILVPTRRDLARSFKHLIEAGWSLSGASDHLVSEALYLNDPEGNGIEIYRDRARDTWEFRNGMFKMASDPLDVQGIMGELANDTYLWDGLPAGTKIGHVHLQVANLEESKAFYNGVLGFDIVAMMPSALFVSAGGYHHHIGLNTWSSRGAPSPPAHSTGLGHFVVELPSRATLDEVGSRLRQAGIGTDETPHGVFANDPSGNRILLSVR